MISLHSNLTGSVASRINKTTDQISGKIEKLSTGKRVNRAGDDVASLSISAKLDSKIKGLGQAKKNIMGAIGHLDVASGAMNATLDNLQRIRELFVQGSNGTNSVDELDALQREVNEIVKSQVDIADNTTVVVKEREWIPGLVADRSKIVGRGEFGLVGFLTDYQVGSEDGQSITFGTNTGGFMSMDPRRNGAAINAGIASADDYMDRLKIDGSSIDSYDGTSTSTTNPLEVIDTMIGNVTESISRVAATYSSMQARFNAVEAEELSLNKALSHFNDVDVAKTSSKLLKEQIKQQTASAVYSQANTQSQFVLGLIP
ncbi:MAG: flagellin [Candidatus Caenarcaniphilales bacterium]|nr:flagellin [Candidatus Caenarcaniphilales bacterium]